MPPNALTNPELYDVLVLAGKRSPGSCKLSGHGFKVTWDVQQGSGMKGARLTLKAIPLRVFTATFELFDEADINAWPDYERVIYSSIPNSGDPVALQCEHPDLASRRITSCVLAELGGVEHFDDGRQKIAVQFQEYAPPKSKGGSPGGTTSTSGTYPPKPDPNAAAKAELNNLLNQYKDSPWSR